MQTVGTFSKGETYRGLSWWQSCWWKHKRNRRPCNTGNTFLQLAMQQMLHCKLQPYVGRITSCMCNKFSCCIAECRSNVYFMHENLLHMAIVTDSSTCNVTTSFPGSLFSASLTLGMRYATWSATFCREMLPVQLCLGLNKTFSFAYWHGGIEISDGTVCAHWFNKVILKGNFITVVLKRSIYSKKITETQKASQHSKLLHYLPSYTTNTPRVTLQNDFQVFICAVLNQNIRPIRQKSRSESNTVQFIQCKSWKTILITWLVSSGFYI